MISLQNNDIALIIDPSRGGGILRFDWRDTAIFQPARDTDCSPLGLANFVLVPFSNRIAKGHFSFEGESVNIPPNHPPASTGHAIHGHGWMAPWEVVAKSEEVLHLRYQHTADSWPWDYSCDQEMILTAQGYIHKLSVTNQSAANMPAGLGFHPYFPSANVHLSTKFEGRWHVTEQGLPTEWVGKAGIYDLSTDDPVDTVFTGRRGALEIEWPTHRLTMTPNPDLPETHIFAPSDEDYFCVEPVSHMTDAINRDGLKILAPGECWSTQVEFSVAPQIS
ncbi:aldose 1-epimerase [Parasphingorhabdus cellanae]|uniref:Aldose 1-epimerase n=1 Tax=Parasphingorhabdus cellanae TaxID=2806553 RepID=A0ABX7T3Y7_9SPHN|nr:aldose 1-epimerase [Parasphingorhabdus cellanae]QTD55214.1 aldose 1-epimerase [Parasphingorhabdus cellanae]